MAFDFANLRQRVVSALVLVPIALATVYFGGWAFALLIILATGIALYEWLRIIDPRVSLETTVFASLCLAGIIAAAAWRPEMAFNVALLTLVLSISLFLWMLRKSKNKWVSFWSAFGLPYIAGSGFALVYAREQDTYGIALVVYVLVVVWGTDIGGYVFGRLIGGPKLAPRISPKKTWAGLIGGMVLAGLFGYSAAAVFDARRPWVVMLVALLLALVAQIGDLFKSYFKRRAGVKDSGSLIPGHGGVLDRIDGLIFAALFFVVLLGVTNTSFGWW